MGQNYYSGVRRYPYSTDVARNPLTFRAISMGLGLPVLWAVLRLMRVPLACPRSEWAEVVRLALPNMILWHAVVIVAVQETTVLLDANHPLAGKDLTFEVELVTIL